VRKDLPEDRTPKRLVMMVVAADNSESRTHASEVILRGGVIAFRTDTFYGLGVDPLNQSAVEKIRQLKGREDAKPILLLISDLSQVDRFITHQSEVFKIVTDRFWPGPLTVVAVARPELPVELTAGTGTIGVRLPDDQGVRALVRACGGALTATSANMSGQMPARSAEDVQNYFPAGVDLIVDGGNVTATEPSTVLDLSGTEARLIREGAVTRDELKDVLLSERKD